MATTMALGAKDASIVDAFLTLMRPLKHDVKALIAERLMTGVAEDDETNDKMKLFNEVKGSWCCDGLTAEEEIAEIRKARTQGVTRIIEEL